MCVIAAAVFADFIPLAVGLYILTTAAPGAIRPAVQQSRRDDAKRAEQDTQAQTITKGTSFAAKVSGCNGGKNPANQDRNSKVGHTTPQLLKPQLRFGNKPVPIEGRHDAAAFVTPHIGNERTGPADFLAFAR